MLFTFIYNGKDDRKKGDDAKKDLLKTGSVTSPVHRMSKTQNQSIYESAMDEGVTKILSLYSQSVKIYVQIVTLARLVLQEVSSGIQSLS